LLVHTDPFEEIVEMSETLTLNFSFLIGTMASLVFAIAYPLVLASWHTGGCM
jgi:hypothetical protein